MWAGRASRRGLWTCGALVAWTAISPQLFLVAVILAVSAGRRNLRALPTPLLLAFVTIAPTIWSLFGPNSSELRATIMTSLPWETDQSASVREAVAGTGYFTHYWETASATVPLGWIVTFTAPLAVVALVSFRPRMLFAWGLGACYLLGVALISGLKGPLAAPLAFLFATLPPFSAFRELYHFAVLTEFPAAVGTSVLITRVPKSAGPVAATAFIACVAWPWLSGAVLGQDGSAYRRSDVQLFAPSQPSRIAFEPLVNPIGPVGATYGGTEPDAQAADGREPFWIYLPSGIEGAAAFALADGSSRDFAAISRALGISVIERRRGFESKVTRTSMYRPLAYAGFGTHVGVPRWPLIRAASRSGDRDVFIAPSRTSLVRLLSVGPPEPEPPRGGPKSVRGLDANSGWASADDFWYVGPGVAEAAGGVVTTNAAARDGFPPCSSSEPVSHKRRRSIPALPDGWKPAARTCDGAPVARLVDSATIAWSRLGPLLRWQRTLNLGRAPELGLGVVARGDGFSLIVRNRCSHCRIALSESAADGWILSGPNGIVPRQSGATPFNEWAIDARPGDHYEIDYAPQRLAYSLGTLAWVSWLVLLARALLPLRRPIVVHPAT